MTLGLKTIAVILGMQIMPSHHFSSFRSLNLLTPAPVKIEQKKVKVEEPSGSNIGIIIPAVVVPLVLIIAVVVICVLK